jgi:lysophospholipase L1-like esterase
MGSFIPPVDLEKSYESIVRFDSSKMREITINFPPYSSVSELYIGISETAGVNAPQPYTIQKPIVYYGSSITQGACASRPGNAYTVMVSRRLNADHINLGFSGNAKGEQEMAEYIRDLDMSAFVYDYDYNAPSVEHLKDTHGKMFHTIRQANPDLPILMLSRPKYYLTPEEEQRREVVQATYQNAIANGDKNVYFLDGKALMSLAGNDGSVDTCHPNDWGFASMAKAVEEVLQGALKKQTR